MKDVNRVESRGRGRSRRGTDISKCNVCLVEVRWLGKQGRWKWDREGRGGRCLNEEGKVFRGEDGK